MISLTANVFGIMDNEGKEVHNANRQAALAKQRRATADKNEAVNKKRGRNSSTKRWMRKRANIMDEKKFVRNEKIQKIHAKRKADREDKERKETGAAAPTLRRFNNLLR